MYQHTSLKSMKGNFSNPNRLKLVINLLRAVESDSEMQKLLEAILTPSELHSLGERAEIVRGIINGKTQREISEQTGAGVATIGRGSRELKFGSGIFQKLFARIS